MKKNKKSLRIFIGLRELSGYYTNLKKGLDAHGVESVFVNLSGHPYKYGIDNNPPWANSINRLANKFGSYFFSNLFMRILWVGLLQNILSLNVFVWALFKYDVFIFGSNSSFFFFLDLPILKICQKKIIYVFHGSESRPVYLNGYVLKNDRSSTIILGIILARIQKIIISTIERFADYSISIPPQAYFHTRPFISWLIIGVPQYVTGNKVVLGSECNDHPVRILHAPSKPEPKGTFRIRDIIKSLQGKGHNIEYVEITGRPNAEVLAEIEKSDFIVDELYSDTPMAVFATEAAFSGKPAIVGGYYSEQIYNDLPSDKIPPSMFCHPDKTEHTIEKMIMNKEFRHDLGRKAYEYVTANWDSEKVAERYLMLIHGNPPQEWFYDPRNIRYSHGCGLSELKVKKIIKRFIDIGGLRSLCLSDKPKLEKMFVQFASSKNHDQTII